MSDQINIPVVDITIGSNMYGRISDLPNTPSHVLAEFVDNALQSYYDNRDQLCQLNPNYRLRIEIDFSWEGKNATSITIKDNAGGINAESYASAFKLANTPTNNQGLNEFGMGLKTAALWLGESWSVKTSALNESVSRTVSFDLNEVILNGLKSLVVVQENEDVNEHYTIVKIEALTGKAPSHNCLTKIKTELSSIYRKFLRLDEVDIIVDGERLEFIETEILCTPSTKDPQGPAIYWRKDIDFTFGKYKAKGFIAILKDIDSTKNGFVLLRRGRVVYGAETDGRYFPKSLSGSTGTFRYKRLFGELELEGFAVSFNKNDLQDKENLEALMEALRSEIHTKDFDLYSQAEDYRLDTRQKSINTIVKTHDNNKRKLQNQQEAQPELPFLDVSTKEEAQPVVVEPVVMGHFDDDYHVNGTKYRLHVEMVNSGHDLFWLDISNKSSNMITCKINMNHEFFKYFQKSDRAIVAILKTMALAKFTAKEFGNDTTDEMADQFNTFIKSTKV